MHRDDGTEGFFADDAHVGRDINDDRGFHFLGIADTLAAGEYFSAIGYSVLHHFLDLVDLEVGGQYAHVHFVGVGFTLARVDNHVFHFRLE